MQCRLSRIPDLLRITVLALLAAGPAAAAHAEPVERDRTRLEVGADDFICMQQMTPTGRFFVDNLYGDIDATVAVAESATGGTYPPGSVVQLVPGEVMVKHPEGYNPATRDWEFLELDVTPEGTSIRARGFADVVNRFGGNCFGCHVMAEPQWDMICKTGRGCDPIPLTLPMIQVLQKADPRCESAGQLTAEEQELLQALLSAGS